MAASHPCVRVWRLHRPGPAELLHAGHVRADQHRQRLILRLNDATQNGHEAETGWLVLSQSSGSTFVEIDICWSSAGSPETPELVLLTARACFRHPQLEFNARPLSKSGAIFLQLEVADESSGTARGILPRSTSGSAEMHALRAGVLRAFPDWLAKA